MSPISRIGTISRQVLAIEKPTIFIPPTNINMVNVPYNTGQPLGVKPIINPISWGYTYLGNQPPLTQPDYQYTPSRVVYTRIPCPGNAFVPWEQPNCSNVPSYGGAYVPTAEGYRPPP